MPVYFIQAGDDGPIKIGWALNPQRRLALFQTGHAAPLRIIRTVDGGPKEEAAFHGRFSASRIRGEWFSFAPEMLSVTAAELMRPVCPINPAAELEPPPVPNATPAWGALQRALKAAGGASALARAIGLSRQAVQQWKRIPGTSVEAVHIATGIPPHELRPDLYGAV
jgi:hypothetical protein